MASAPEFSPPPETSKKRPSRFDALAFVVEVSTLLEDEDIETISKSPNPPQIHPSPPPQSRKRPAKSLPPPKKRAINPQVPESKTQVPDLNLSVPQEFMDVMNSMGITDGPVLVIDKYLFPTDVASNQNRTSMPEKSVNPEFINFLTDEEKEILRRKEDNEIPVQMIEPECKRVSNGVVFKRWKMKKDSGSVSYMYIFNGAVWRKIRKDNCLEAWQRIQFWAFRNRDHRLAFANAFQLAFVAWTLYEFGPKSCFHEHTEDFVITLVMGILIEILYSYVTLPLYALVTQMGSNMKPTIFNDRVAAALRNWHHTAKKHVKHNKGSVTPMSSRPTTPSHRLSPVHLLRNYRSEMDSAQTSPRRSNFEMDHWEDYTDSPSPSHPNHGDVSFSYENAQIELDANEPSSSTAIRVGTQHEIDVRSQKEFSFDKRMSTLVKVDD